MTFSIIARCPRTGMLGVATSSKWLAAGGLVPFCRGGLGAVASQSFANPYLGIDALHLLEAGLPAERALEKVIESDPGRDLRQVGIVDNAGRADAYTGTGCIPWAGHHIGGAFVCLGNILAGPRVVSAMVRSFERSADAELPERLLAALQAGQEAGGDRRGRQSAGIIVYGDDEYPVCDLRVDDHPDPIPELTRLYEIHKRDNIPSQDTMPHRGDFIPNWEEVLHARDRIAAELDESPGEKEHP